MKFKAIVVFLVLILAVIMAFNVKPIGRYLLPIKYKNNIYESSQKFDLNPILVAALIKTESNYDPNASSTKGAIGLMQLTPDTAAWAAEQMGIKNFKKEMLYDPKFNINMGCWYLSDLIKEFNGNLDVTLAAYNAGLGNVRKWLSDNTNSKDGKNLSYIPFKETDKYVKRVNTFYSIYNFLYAH